MLALMEASARERSLSRTDRSALVHLNPLWATLALVAGALVTWLVTFDRMGGMDMGPGTDLGGLGWFLSIWVVTMAAMMFPSVAPMVLVFARVGGERARGGQAAFVPTWMFVAGWLSVWATYGLVAYGVFRLIRFLDLGFLAWDEAGPYVAGAAVAAGGLYQLTPLKDLCLRHCRTPLHFVFHGWREGRLGALRMGGEHGFYCVGCCWGLFIILFAVGVMSLFWMAMTAAVIFLEKVVPHGNRLSRLFAVGFIALGIWIAAAPSSVPGLTEPQMGSDMGQMPMGR
jgi:predicted metal-binding membrane protein